MTIKLKNNEQVEGLELILRVMLSGYSAQNMSEQLVRDLAIKAYIKIRTRAESITRQGYSINLTPEEAKGVFIFYANTEIPLGYDYELRVLETIIGQIENDYLSRNQQTNIRTGALAPGSPSGLRSIQA